MYPREYFDTYWRGSLREEVFVVMSFADEFMAVWEQAIRPAIEADNTPLRAHRVDATVLAGSIVTEIFDGIAHSQLVFAEISIARTGRWSGQRNGNAMYELGLAHAIRPASDLVVVRADDDEINFDIAHLRVHRYDRDALTESRERFASLIRHAQENRDATKGLMVERAIASLDVACVNLLLKAGRAKYFHLSGPQTMRDVMEKTASGEEGAVRHLLGLGMLRFDANPGATKYAYHWTEFGHSVLQYMEITAAAGNEIGATPSLG